MLLMLFIVVFPSMQQRQHDHNITQVPSGTLSFHYTHIYTVVLYQYCMLDIFYLVIVNALED